MTIGVKLVLFCGKEEKETDAQSGFPLYIRC